MSAILNHVPSDKGKKVESREISPVPRIAADFPKSYPKPRQFLIDKALTAQSRYSSESLLLCIDTLLDAEQRMKSTGGDADIILDETVAKLFSIK